MIRLASLIIVLTGFLFLGSCRSVNKGGKHETPKPAEKTDGRESNLFFDAEKARLSGDAKQAYALYNNLVNAYPNNATGRYNLARLQFQREELPNAEKNAVKAHELDPSNRYFTELLAEIYIYQKKNKQAEPLMATLADAGPGNEEYLYRLAMFHLKNKEYDKAIQAFNRLESLTGLSEEVMIERKNVYLRQGKTDLAIGELLKLREYSPQDVQYPLMMIEIFNNAGQKDKARGMYDELERKYGADPIAQIELARWYFEQQDLARSNQYMQKVMKNRNLDPEAKIALIIPMLRHLESGKDEDQQLVVSMARSIAEESPDSHDAVGLYAEVLYFMKDYDAALEQYRAALKLDLGKYQPWNQIITIFIERQQYDSALLYCDRSLERFPNNPQPWFLKGILYAQMRQSEKSIVPLSKAAELEPENPALQAQIYSLLGDAYHSAKNFRFSDSCYEKALKLTPDDAGTLNNYAYYLSLRRERLVDAEKMSKRSLDLQPESKSFLDTYGWILYQLGRLTEARTYIEKALGLSGEDDGTLNDHLGDILFKLGEKDKALAHWKKAIEQGADNPLLPQKISDAKLYE